MPKVKMNLRYKPMPHLTHSSFYQYHVPKVYTDSLNFNWKDRDYIITQDDRDFLNKVNSQIRDGMITISPQCQGQTAIPVKQQPLTEDDLESIIDFMEKIVSMTKIKTEKHLLESFYGRKICDEALQKKLNRQVFSRLLIPYWNLGRGTKKRVAFIRKFWENPDANDPCPHTAFKKRIDNSRM